MKTETVDFYNESVNRAIAFMESNASGDIFLDDVALAAGLSPYHFHRIFRQISGKTVKGFISRVRIEKAAFHLKNSDADITQIAFLCGYKNPETFTRAFRSVFGSTPSEYRAGLSNGKETGTDGGRDIKTFTISRPEIKTLPGIHIAYVRHTGSYELVPDSFKKLMFWALKHLALKMRPATLGILQNDPLISGEDHIRFDACVQLSRKINPSGSIGYKYIDGGQYAVFRYCGPYEDFYDVYDYIYYLCLKEYHFLLGDKPALEWYIKSPPFYKPKDYVTDFYVPIL
ncbi:hypothetical protein CHU92_10405 [Flavobacterium cyanobacteriorum]|uniref:HTH araC/xylS-type domain-containing protein n=1 Tax=Flavobacterium cyanobacteriorum TaxID=2022802 RepID=A0A255Z541_9FLAO|nr:GyrI-like domain-containing protein [Flavobacterium cyanobacteriorum]OYQ35760.1 hypothetical protein CHU92_10405 [Flavobacterium cyanobacteriorum]